MSRKKYALASDFSKGLGGRIKSALKGRPQTWLAASLGVAEPRVSEWIRGEVIPGADTLSRILRALECDAAWLLLGDPKSHAEISHYAGVREDALYSSSPKGVSPEAWEAIRPFLPLLAEIWEARNDPDTEIAAAWGWITGNLRMFRRGVKAPSPEIPQRERGRKEG